MGVEDRDWYRDAQREREKTRQIEETRHRFSSFSNKHLGAGAISPTRTGLIPMMVFWCLVMAVLYFAMSYYLKPKGPEVVANGDLVIKRSLDGHFRTLGNVNGREVKFLVDTGASLVSVSENFAQSALLRGGVPATFHTANGDQAGRVVENVAISVGPVTVSNVRVGVGLRMQDENEALLGQSFLSKFDISIVKDKMVLRSR